MPSLRSLYPAIRLAIACLVLAIGLRTWLVMGLIEPVTVSGSSMVPALRGASVSPICPKCEHAFSVGAEFAINTEEVACPQCAYAKVPLDSLRLQQADRLWVDRISMRWRQPERWEVVVAQNPEDVAQLCVKRIIGLPGEQVDLRNGNVRIDGAVIVKSPADQTLLRQLVHREGNDCQRWLPAPMSDQPSGWQPGENVWKYSGLQQGDVDWLRYHHSGGQPITDDVTYNAGLTRQLNLVDEFLLATDLKIAGNGTLHLAIDDGRATAQISLSYPDGKVELRESKRFSATVQLPDETLQRLSDGEVQLQLGNFDQQLLLVVADQVELRRQWPNTRAVGTAQPFSIGVQGLDVQLSNLSVYRDIYHTNQAVDAAAPRVARWLLASDEYFLLGDNAPISLDSRTWGPVPFRRIIGKPLLSGR